MIGTKPAEAAPAAAEETRAERRRRAFETNLRIRLAAEAGDLDPVEREGLVRALGASFARTRHMIDARTVARFAGLSGYAVLQVGATKVRGEGHPFAARVMSGAGAAIGETRRAAVARAVAGAEISRRHRVSLRGVWRLGRLRAYATLVAGPDRRRRRTMVEDDRRAPEQPTVGFLMLLGFVGVLSAAGAALILATLWAFGELMTQEPGRAVFAQLFHSTLEAAGR